MSPVKPYQLAFSLLSIFKTKSSFLRMKDNSSASNESTTYTTNLSDLNAAAAFKARLRSNSNPPLPTSPSYTPLTSSVSIDEGTHKYVLISAKHPNHSDDDDDKQYFVVSKKGAAYHRNVAEGFVSKLEAHGYSNIHILGGGRISLDSLNTKISIFGFSYGFGLADHSLSQRVIQSDARFQTFDINWSNDGY